MVCLSARGTRAGRSRPLSADVRPVRGRARALPAWRTLAGDGGHDRATADDVSSPSWERRFARRSTDYHPAGGLELEGDGLAFSCAKESEDGEWLVLRCVNVTDVPARGSWRLPFRTAAARLARLDETPLGAIDVIDGSVTFHAGARAVVTLLVR